MGCASAVTDYPWTSATISRCCLSAIGKTFASATLTLTARSLATSRSICGVRARLVFMGTTPSSRSCRAGLRSSTRTMCRSRLSATTRSRASGRLTSRGPAVFPQTLSVEQTGTSRIREIGVRQRGICVRVGMEATGYSRWFERLLAEEANKRPEALRLMTHPGVGPITALAYVLIIGTPERFHRGKQIGTYVGMIPTEDSSAGKQRLGHISKQGNSLLRYLLVEAAQAATRFNPHWRRRYLHLAMRRHRSIAKVAMGRRMAIRLYWTWRNGCEYLPSLEFGSYAGQLEKRQGGK